jgi:hypothetical protein
MLLFFIKTTNSFCFLFTAPAGTPYYLPGLFPISRMISASEAFGYRSIKLMTTVFVYPFRPSAICLKACKWYSRVYFSDFKNILSFLFLQLHAKIRIALHCNINRSPEAIRIYQIPHADLYPDDIRTFFCTSILLVLYVYKLIVTLFNRLSKAHGIIAP